MLILSVYISLFCYYSHKTWCIWSDLWCRDRATWNIKTSVSSTSRYNTQNRTSVNSQIPFSGTQFGKGKKNQLSPNIKQLPPPPLPWIQSSWIEFRHGGFRRGIVFRQQQVPSFNFVGVGSQWRLLPRQMRSQRQRRPSSRSRPHPLFFLQRRRLRQGNNTSFPHFSSFFFHSLYHRATSCTIFLKCELRIRVHVKLSTASTIKQIVPRLYCVNCLGWRAVVLV